MSNFQLFSHNEKYLDSLVLKYLCTLRRYVQCFLAMSLNLGGNRDESGGEEKS